MGSARKVLRVTANRSGWRPTIAWRASAYGEVLAVVEAAWKDPALKATTVQAAVEADMQLIKPLFEFRNFWH